VAIEDFDAKVRRLRRSRAASIAAYSLHEQRPELAAEAGRKGGEARAKQFTSEYARWAARKRWYGSLAGPPPP
jgi:Stress-induced bacterial acidophilic repeat motif